MSFPTILSFPLIRWLLLGSLLGWEIAIGLLVLRRRRQLAKSKSTFEKSRNFGLLLTLIAFELSASFVLMFGLFSEIGVLCNSVTLFGVNCGEAMLKVSAILLPYVKWLGILAGSTSVGICVWCLGSLGIERPGASFIANSNDERSGAVREEKSR